MVVKKKEVPHEEVPVAKKEEAPKQNLPNCECGKPALANHKQCWDCLHRR